MTDAVWLAGAQGVIILVLAGDRFVHRLVGQRSIESRVDDLERRFGKASAEFSKTWGAIQAQMGKLELEQVRQEEHFKATDGRVTRLENG